VKSEEDIQIETKREHDAGGIEFYSFNPGAEVAETTDVPGVFRLIVSPFMIHVS